MEEVVEVPGVVEKLEEVVQQLEELNKTLTHLVMVHLSALLFISALLALLVVLR